MRRTTVLACMMALLLLVPLAAAARDAPGKPAERPERPERPEEARGAEAAQDNATGGKPAFVAKLQALRVSWLESAAAIRDACRAVEKDDNATKEEQKSWAHCIRDGFKLWRAEHRVERREMRDAARAG